MRIGVAKEIKPQEYRVALTPAGALELVHRGHDVIGHGNEHRRLALLDETSQRAEIERTREFVTAVGGTWALSFPYGSRDETTLRLLDEHDCLLGLTTESRRATEADSLLELPRIDTNDLRLEVVERGGLDGPSAESA